MNGLVGGMTLYKEDLWKSHSSLEMFEILVL